MSARGDLAIVQYALTLEHLETDFYNAVTDAGVIKKPMEMQAVLDAVKPFVAVRAG
jgi:Ferritin-like domain